MARIAGWERGFPLVQLMAYTPYVLVLSMFALLFVVLCRRWLAAGFLLIGVLALALAVLPREIGGPEEVPGGQPVRILSLNLGRGYAHADEVAELARVRDADLVAVQEITPEAVAKLDHAGFSVLYPHRVLLPAPQASGGGIYSRWPLRDLGRLEGEFNQPRAGVVVPGALPIELDSVHPMAPTTPSNTGQWADEYDTMPAAGTTDLPLVLAGDFNATLDHAKLRDLIDTGYRDAAEVYGSGLVTTWPSRLEWPPPVTIDHVLAERGISVAEYDVERVAGTDHRAIFSELLLPPVNPG
ncbi:MAG: endonuclease/exonuclease/phosphatase family protein [Solirubrobacterales bacterium]|nr:endonuclease/exonuclease/phosphatase family protein [Solirubrobacterales bacterium]